MAELVECARLEIAYTGNCIGGSNPSISARYEKAHPCGVFFIHQNYNSLSNGRWRRPIYPGGLMILTTFLHCCSINVPIRSARLEPLTAEPQMARGAHWGPVVLQPCSREMHVRNRWRILRSFLQQHVVAAMIMPHEFLFRIL